MSLPRLPDSQTPVSLAVRPRILLAEDDRMVGEMLRMVLEEDYEVLYVANSEQALLAFSDQRIDVVLLDYWLSGESGHAVADRADQASVPIVWMTGERNAAAMLETDLHVLLLKPFSVSLVQETLATALRRGETMAVSGFPQLVLGKPI